MKLLYKMFIRHLKIDQKMDKVFKFNKQNLFMIQESRTILECSTHYELSGPRKTNNIITNIIPQLLDIVHRQECETLHAILVNF